jgi:hypothetical protein
MSIPLFKSLLPYPIKSGRMIKGVLFFKVPIASIIDAALLERTAAITEKSLSNLAVFCKAPRWNRFYAVKSCSQLAFFIIGTTLGAHNGPGFTV